MCYLVREPRAGAAGSGGASQPTGPDRLRPRWIGAIAAALMASLAVAAIVAPSPSTLSNAKQSEAPAPLAAKLTAVPAAGVERTAAPLAVDDEVPRAAAGHCDHGL